MIFALLLLIVILIAFSEIGFAAFLVLPMVAVIVVGLFAFFGMLGGVKGAGEIFAWCALITGAVVAVMYLVERKR